MATVAARDILRPIRLPAYTFLGLTILLQGADFLLTLAPFRPSAVMWRFSALVAAPSNVGNVLLLLLLLYVFALLMQDGPGLAAVVGLTSVLAIVLFVAGAAFALDALQLRSRVDTQVVQRFDVTAAEAIVKFIAQGIVSVLIAVSALRSWRLAKRHQVRLRGERVPEELVMMRSAPSPRPVQD